MHRNAAIKVLVFDLGGVVIEIDWEQAFRSWAEYTPLSLDEIRERFQMDAAYKEHERGKMSRTAYFAHLRDVLEFAGDDEALMHGWNAILVGEVKETVNVLRALKTRIPLYLLTNSNPTHETAWRARFPTTIELFTEVFVSSSLGHRKPEPLAFEAAARKIGVDLSSILFFDDTMENIEGARIAGLQAVHVTKPSDISRVLRIERVP